MTDLPSMDQQMPPGVAAGSPGRMKSSGAASSDAVQWRLFLRALADQVDHLAGAGVRDELLRAVGRRMARMLPLPAVVSLEALELEMNDALEALGWGAMSMRLDEAGPALMISHAGLPRIGSLGTPPGQWLSALLEGLYETWLAQQPGSQPSLSAVRVATGDPVAVTLRFGKG